MARKGEIVRCELAIDVDTSGPSPVVQVCGRPGYYVKTSAFAWEVAMCREHHACQPGRWHVVPHRNCQ